MPTFTIRTVNAAFFTEMANAHFANPDEALAFGVKAALMIAGDEIGRGETAAAVEVLIEDGSGRPVRRSAVSVAVASLAIGAVEQRPAPTEANDR